VAPLFALIKAVAYLLSSTTRENHRLVKKHFSPLVINLGSNKKPVQKLSVEQIGNDKQLEPVALAKLKKLGIDPSKIKSAEDTRKAFFAIFEALLKGTPKEKKVVHEVLFGDSLQSNADALKQVMRAVNNPLNQPLELTAYIEVGGEVMCGLKSRKFNNRGSS
jgi:hypothetical protein